MYIESESRAVIREYSKMIKDRSSKTQKIWLISLLGFVVLLVGIALIPGLLDYNIFFSLFLTYGGMILVFLIGAVIFSFLTISDKPAFNYLYGEIYDKINLEKGTYYDYTPFEKADFDFNKRGGLFNKHARISVKRHVKGTSPNDSLFEIFDTTLVTGGGKNKRVHLNGIYCIVKHSSSNLFQIRTNSKPRLEGVKFEQVESEKEFKVFVEEGNEISNNEHKYIDTLIRLKRNLKAKKIYLGTTRDEIHFAYVPGTRIRKQNNLSTKKLNVIYELFLDEIRYIDELKETSEF